MGCHLPAARTNPHWNFKHGIKKQHFSISFFDLSCHFRRLNSTNENKPWNPIFPFHNHRSSLQLQPNAPARGVPWCWEGYAMSLHEVNLDASVKRILRLSNSTSLSTVRVPWLFVFYELIPAKKNQPAFFCCFLDHIWRQWVYCLRKNM